jgi:hypothetical protein
MNLQEVAFVSAVLHFCGGKGTGLAGQTLYFFSTNATNSEIKFWSPALQYEEI